MEPHDDNTQGDLSGHRTRSGDHLRSTSSEGAPSSTEISPNQSTPGRHKDAQRSSQQDIAHLLDQESIGANLNNLAGIAISQTRVAPLPSPAELQAYGELIENAPERFMLDFEKTSEQSRENARVQNANDTLAVRAESSAIITATVAISSIPLILALAALIQGSISYAVGAVIATGLNALGAVVKRRRTQ